MSVDELRPVEYRPVSRFPGYRVGDDGSVWSRWARKSLGHGKGTASVMTDEWSELAGSPDKDGYRKIILCAIGERRYVRVNVLVLETFRSPRPLGFTAAHENGVRADNRLSNLSWKTQKANLADKIRHGTHQAGERHPMSRLTEEKVSEIRMMRNEGRKWREIADILGEKLATVHAAGSGRNWGYIHGI